MVRSFRKAHQSGYTVLVVDDNMDYLEAIGALLEGEGHTVLSTTSGQHALEILRQGKVDLLLLDYFMPGMTGEEVVARMREFDPYTQVILQTGYASDQPPLEMLRKLDIQGYYDKGESLDKLLLWTEAGLKAAYTIRLLNKSRSGLRYLLDVTPDMHKIQPLNDLLKGILLQVCGLLSVVDSFIALVPGHPEEGGAAPDATKGFVVMVEKEMELRICVGTGEFASHTLVEECLDSSKAGSLRTALQGGEVLLGKDFTMIPLHLGEQTLGLVYLDRSILDKEETELIRLFSNQAAVAIHNAQLYEMATLDPLTGAYVRGYFDQLLVREIRSAFRSQQPLCLLMTDLDGFRKINDTYGRLVGDHALAKVGQAIREATRAGDLVGRYSDDTFSILLPGTRKEKAEVVAQRIQAQLQQIDGPEIGTPLPITSSAGLGILPPFDAEGKEIPRPMPQAYFEATGELLLRHTNSALLTAKKAGGGCLQIGPPAGWENL